MNKVNIFLQVFLLVVLLAFAAFLVSARMESEIPSETQQVTETFLSPLYLTVVIHTEEDTHGCAGQKGRIPDYDGDEALLLHFTNVMRKFGLMAQQHGAKIDFGTDWTFSQGVESFDPTFFTDMEAMGHQIDAHAHESCYDYEEVKADIVSAGGHPTSVVSGLDEEEIYDMMVYFDDLYPEFTLFWGVASPGHGEGEQIAGWVWRPSREDWTQHDSEGEYLYIGSGEGVNSIDSIETAIENRRENTINTYAVFLAPRELKAEVGAEAIDEDWVTKPSDCAYWENKLDWWDNFLSQIDAYVETGEVEYASLPEIADVFEKQESQLIFDQQDLPRSADPAASRNKDAGYCL